MNTPTDMERLLHAYEAVRTAPDDPEHTMHLELTDEELALAVFGTTLIQMQFSELGLLILPFIQKIAETSAAQGFVEYSEEAWKNMGLEPLPGD